MDWLREHSSENGAGMHGGWTQESGVDVIFMDVELEDGDCFEIFRQVDIRAKVIMTTAYDSYAIKAFEAGSVDYLLKPISPEDLDRAVNRVIRDSRGSQDFSQVLQALESGKQKERFIVRMNDRIVPVAVLHDAGVLVEHLAIAKVDRLTARIRVFVLVLAAGGETKQHQRRKKHAKDLFSRSFFHNILPICF